MLLITNYNIVHFCYLNHNLYFIKICDNAKFSIEDKKYVLYTL